jgi:hypothetical protein
MLLAPNARGAYFQDNFDRPDGEVGNGWKIWREGNLDIKIEDNELVIAGQQGTAWKRSGIYRPVEGETRFSFDFKADDNLNLHIELWDTENLRFVDFYAWPGGSLSFRYGSDRIALGPGITGQYHNLVVEQEGLDFTLTLDGDVIGTFTSNNMINIDEVFLCADAAADTVGSLHIDNVVIGQPPMITNFDFNGDGTVDVNDVVTLTNYWGQDYSVCDVTCDGIVDAKDLLVLAEHLLEEVSPPKPIVVDDFESYTDVPGSIIWDTWRDSFVNNTGACIGYVNPPHVEVNIVHGGNQAMPFFYDNDGTVLDGTDFETKGTLFYAETRRRWVEPQDWTMRDVEILTLWFYGETDNPGEPFYVGLEDSAGNRKDIIHPDPAVLTVNDWQQWRTPLADFADVDLTAIMIMYIGAGDPASNQPGGSGLVRIDDIELHRSSGQ